MIKTSFFRFFDDICKIPRNSGCEQKAAEYLISFAEERGLDCYTDANNNVLISKPATPGMESVGGVVLQGHTDMVCIASPGVEHDFSRDPITYTEKDGFIRADGTTLGGDDGAAVALMLALLDDKEAAHPYLQCLFTTEEETGLFGATAFDADKLKAGYMINIDGEQEGEAIVSCAGGLRVHYKLPVVYTDDKRSCFRVSVSGFAGGHSGVDINAGRTNAVTFLAGLLTKMNDISPLYISSFSGGLKDNAIPSGAEAVICCDARTVAIVCEGIYSFSDADKNAHITYETCGECLCISGKDTEALLGLLCSLYCGVIKMSASIDGLVQTSQNIGIVRTENGCFEIFTSLRSSDDKEKERIADGQTVLGEKYGFTVERGQRYPGWLYKEESVLREVYKDAYRTVHGGKEPVICAIHAGLECGIFAGKKPGLDIISLGPTILNVHTPAEALDTESVGYICDTVKHMLKNLR